MNGKPVSEILDRLERRSNERASPGTALGRKSSWERTPFTVLIATILSQRNRDECTYAASEKLFAKYPTPALLMNAPLEEVDSLIRTVNFHTSKARAIKEIARMVQNEHGGEVPRDIDSLMGLPMVGRKTATCVQGYAFHMDVICVDTHVHRISNRIGLVNSKTPEETEIQLMKVVPRNRWSDINEVLVRFGQEVCTPLRPKHELCPIRDYCDMYQRNLKENEGQSPKP